MTHPVHGQPDPTRLQLLQSVFEPSPLATVAEAVTVATEHETHIYVERPSDGWRWSLAHRGGSNPLLRVTAGLLQVHYRTVMIGFRTLLDGFSVLCDDPKVVQHPEVAAIIEFEADSSPADANQRILHRLRTGGTNALC